MLAINIVHPEADYTAHIEEGGYEHILFARDGSGEIARRYGVHSLPTIYLLDREGVIPYARSGFNQRLERQLQDEIADLYD